MNTQNRIQELTKETPIGKIVSLQLDPSTLNDVEIRYLCENTLRTQIEATYKTTPPDIQMQIIYASDCVSSLVLKIYSHTQGGTHLGLSAFINDKAFNRSFLKKYDNPYYAKILELCSGETLKHYIRISPQITINATKRHKHLLVDDNFTITLLYLSENNYITQTRKIAHTDVKDGTEDTISIYNSKKAIGNTIERNIYKCHPSPENPFEISVLKSLNLHKHAHPFAEDYVHHAVEMTRWLSRQGAFFLENIYDMLFEALHKAENQEQFFQNIAAEIKKKQTLDISVNDEHPRITNAVVEEVFNRHLADLAQQIIQEVFT